MSLQLAVTYKTFRDVFSALESGKVKHALFDTYAIGSEKALFKKAKHLHIYQIYDYASTYGIVIGGESRVLQKCFNMFKRLHIEDIFRNIKDNIDSIEVRGTYMISFALSQALTLPFPTSCNVAFTTETN